MAKTGSDGFKELAGRTNGKKVGSQDGKRGKYNASAAAVLADRLPSKWDGNSSAYPPSRLPFSMNACAHSVRPDDNNEQQ